MELLDIYDENRRKTGMTRERSDPLQPGWYDPVSYTHLGAREPKEKVNRA